MTAHHWGKYRGVVLDGADPRSRGRVRVSVPSVMGEGESAWAMPCVPYAGARLDERQIPPAGTPIWVEFEGGSPSQPIWVGRFWGGLKGGASPLAGEADSRRRRERVRGKPGTGAVSTGFRLRRCRFRTTERVRRSRASSWTTDEG